MIALIQRVRYSKLQIDGKVHSSIGKGMLILLGISSGDSEKEAEWLASKIASLRIFSDENGKMNLDVKANEGEIMVVSQFTLLADASQGHADALLSQRAAGATSRGGARRARRSGRHRRYRCRQMMRRRRWDQR